MSIKKFRKYEKEQRDRLKKQKKHKKHVKKVKMSAYKKVKAGDIIWAKMPLSEEELFKIPESHRQRPYLVVHKENSFIYAYQCTHSKYLQSLNEYMRYKNTENNNIIDLTKLYEIPTRNLIKILPKKPSKYLIEDIQKRLDIQKNKNIDIKYDFPVNYGILKGDLIEINNKKYYVYDNDNVEKYDNIFGKCYLARVRISQKTNCEYVLINKPKKYYIDFTEVRTLKKFNNLKIFDIASDKQKEGINKFKNANYPYLNIE